MEMQCMKLRPYGKNGYMRIKGTHNIIKCKLIVNKHEKIVLMFIGMMLAFLAENCQDAVMTPSAGKRQRQKTLVKKVVIFDCCTFFCMSLYTSWYCAITATITVFQPCTLSHFLLFEKRAIIMYTRTFVHGGALAILLPFIFLDKTYHQFIYTPWWCSTAAMLILQPQYKYHAF